MLGMLVWIVGVALALALLWLVGRWRIVRDLRYQEKVRNEVIAYQNALMTYANSRGQDRESYVQLLSDSTKMEGYLGYDNLIYNVRVRYTIYNGVPAIPLLINELPLLYGDYFNERHAPDAVGAVNNVLIRHAGRREDAVHSFHERAKNPLACIAEGWKAIVALPISLLSAFGLISERRSSTARQSFWFKLSSVILFVAAIAGTAIAYIADREKVDAALRGLL